VTTVDRTRVFRVVQEALADELEIESSAIVEDSELRADLELDSLAAIALLIDLEERFQVVITDPELQELRSVCDVVDLIVRESSGRT